MGLRNRVLKKKLGFSESAGFGNPAGAGEDSNEK
jgi:hypothetical protein